MTKQALARKLDVSVTTITNWLTEGLPYSQKGSKGKGYEFSIAEVEEWVLQYKSSSSITDDTSYAEARRRRETAMAAIKELELQQRKGNLLDKAVLMNLWGRVMSAFRNRLLSLSAKLSPQLYGAKSVAEVSNLLKKHVDELLINLADLQITNLPADREKKIRNKKQQKGGGDQNRIDKRTGRKVGSKNY